MSGKGERLRTEPVCDELIVEHRRVGRNLDEIDGNRGHLREHDPPQHVCDGGVGVPELELHVLLLDLCIAPWVTSGTYVSMSMALPPPLSLLLDFSLAWSLPLPLPPPLALALPLPLVLTFTLALPLLLPLALPLALSLALPLPLLLPLSLPLLLTLPLPLTGTVSGSEQFQCSTLCQTEL